jgi:hypothetical protein|tara:strand:- start:3603 stop:4034 length:432 start_codon:yes stop_codon:yes gene_type:complete
MILISHRGNINGRNPEMENNPEYIQQALDLGYDVEVDVWGWEDGRLSLGHDFPQYDIDYEFLRQDGIWCHAKDIVGFYLLSKDKDIHCFSHTRDIVALTTKGYFWSTWRQKMTNKTICVMPPRNKKLSNYIAGVCSDYIEEYK